MSIAPRDGEVDDALIALERAAGFDAPGVGLALGTHEHALERTRALDGELPRRQPVRAQCRATGPTTSGITSPALRTTTVSPGRTSFAAHLVLVVQRGHADGGPADEHRLEHGERRGPPGAADRDLDVAQQRGALLGRELVGDGPARRPRREAEPLALGEVVDLHDDTVDLVGEVVAVLLPVATERVDAVEVVDHADLGVHREPEGGEELERLVVGLERRAAHDLAELVAPEAQLARRGDRRILLAEAAGRGVARVREARLAGLRGPLVERLEARPSDMYTSPRTSTTSGAPGGSRCGRPAIVRHVGGDVLADPCRRHGWPPARTDPARSAGSSRGRRS